MKRPLLARILAGLGAIYIARIRGADSGSLETPGPLWGSSVDFASVAASLCVSQIAYRRGVNRGSKRACPGKHKRDVPGRTIRVATQKLIDRELACSASLAAQVGRFMRSRSSVDQDPRDSEIMRHGGPQSGAVGRSARR